MPYSAFKTQRASCPETPVTFSHPTRCHTPQDVCHQHTAVKMNTSSDYTSALVTWQILYRFLDLFLASHVILTPKLDKSRAPTISHIIIYLFLHFWKFHLNNTTQNCPSAAYTEHTSLFSCHFKPSARVYVRGTFRLQCQRWCQVQTNPKHVDSRMAKH
jgi:hypothetical protein